MNCHVVIGMTILIPNTINTYLLYYAYVYTLHTYIDSYRV